SLRDHRSPGVEVYADALLDPAEVGCVVVLRLPCGRRLAVEGQVQLLVVLAAVARRRIEVPDVLLAERDRGQATGRGGWTGIVRVEQQRRSDRDDAGDDDVERRQAAPSPEAAAPRGLGRKRLQNRRRLSGRLA